jgi:omega-amidase
VFLILQIAKEQGVTLVGGSIPETSDGKLYNTCCIYSPDGSLIGKHRKVRMMDEC